MSFQNALQVSIQSSQSYSRGQADAERAFDEEEDECVSGILADNEAFQKGVAEAQDKLTRSCSALSLAPQDQNGTLKIKTGLLYLFTKEASATESYQIRDEAKKLLSENLFPATPVFDEEDYMNVARFGVENMADIFDTEYELGHAAEFVMALTPEDYKHLGYVSHIYHFAEILENLDTGEIADSAPSIGQKGKFYRRFLTEALEAYLSPLLSKVETLIESDIPQKTLGFEAPSP